MYKPGSIRWTDDKGEHIVQPGDPTFSMALFFATEYWDGNQWEKI